MEIWESEVPIRQIRIDEDIEENSEFVKDIHLPPVNNECNNSNQKDYEWGSSSNVEEKDTMYDSKSCKMDLVPEYVVATEFPLDSFADSFVHFCSETGLPAEQQHEQFEGMNAEQLHSDNDTVILEVLQSAPQNNLLYTAEDLKKAKHDSEKPTKTMRKQKQNAGSEKMFDGTACGNSVTGSSSCLDRISLVVPSMNTRVSESVNIAQIREVFQKQKRQRLNPEIIDDDHAIASLIKELVVRVALEHDFIKNETMSSPLNAGETQHHLLKIISLEEAKKDFGDLTLEELLKGVSNLRSSVAVQNYLREWPKVKINIQEQQPITDLPLEQSVDRYTSCSTKTSTKMTTNLSMKPSLRKRRFSSDRPTLPKNLPADQKCIAAVEAALKQSIKGIKGPEETSPAPRTSIL